MNKIIEFSDKQIEYIKNAVNKRWNFKIGATRSGKTTIDYMFVIPDAVRRLKNKKGLNFLCGVSLATIERNVLIPMRDYFGNKLVTETSRDKIGQTIVYIFGELFILLGAEKINAIKKIRGAEAKFIYGDEVVEWNAEFFDFIKTRLSLPYSEFHGSGNPEDENHFVYKFLESIKNEKNVYIQNYTIFDNPFLHPDIVDALCKEYSGTVFYDRYILGKWVRAEGCIYRALADNRKNFILTDEEVSKLNIIFINIGVDFGGNNSKHSFTATGFTWNYEKVIILKSERIETDLTPNELEQRFIQFVKSIRDKYKNTYIKESRLDSAEQVLIRGFKISCFDANIKNAIKSEIIDRIRLITRLIGVRRIFWTKDSETSLSSFATAVWDKKKENVRLDDGSIDIDSIDSTEYSIEPEMKNLLLTLSGGN